MHYLYILKNGFQLQEINVSDFNNPAAKSSTSAFRFEQTDYLVVQPKVNTESYLKENGMNVQSYLGDGYYLVAMDANNTQTGLQKIVTTKVGYITPASKVDEYLSVDKLAVPVTVLFAPAIETQKVTSICQSLGIVIENFDETNHHFSA